MKKPERTTGSHIYFWGSFYSQWSKYKIEDKTVKKTFSSCEQYMMWNKAMLFNDKKCAQEILATHNVKTQKAIGRTVKNFDQKKWDLMKFEIVYNGNLLKFSQNLDIQKELLSTENKTIVEASPYDKIYGVGIKYDNDLILKESNWKGQNLLGKAIMKVREALKQNSIPDVKKYDKLIRDNIPQIIDKNKKQCLAQRETDKNKLLRYYVKKLKEELGEVIGSKNKQELIEELADLSEVMDGLLDNLNLRDSVEQTKTKKKNEKGGFTNLILKSVSNKIEELKPTEKETHLFTEVNGSILQATESIIAQGCNCSGASGAGIAKYIGEAYPDSDALYKQLCRDKKFKLGTVMFHTEKGKTQAFCGTQLYYGKFLKMDDSSVESRYGAIEECLIKIYTKAKAENLSVALPRIGCGRARANWDRVKRIIKKIFHDHPVTIYFIPDNYTKKI